MSTSTSTSPTTTTATAAATITPNLPSFVCDSANYMLLPSAVAVAAVAANKEVQLQTYEYLSKHHRTAVSAAVAVAAAAAVAKSGKCTKSNEEYANVMNTTNPPTTKTANTLAAAAAAVTVYDVHPQQQSINPTIYHTPKNLFIANNMKPRPRRETT
ncbi:uncharacterized protein LOC119688500 [Teleopsis dalmanni]|uniref:uncharacterized protein LOC119688500 n=1 Tax=Teleopsis dalmanni TaxID=139649 RepID=UPI0018CE17DE|nr:uncharacterized protein LOC119688500 [Teleopsis dalmanni]